MFEMEKIKDLINLCHSSRVSLNIKNLGNKIFKYVDAFYLQ